MTPLRRLLIAGFLLIAASSVADQNDIVGRWLSGDGDGWVDIRIEGDTLVGIAVSSPNTKPGDPPRYDDLNPDPALRARCLAGLKFMSGFKYAGGNKWTGGTIYDPNSGKTYRGSLTLIDENTLKLRGYVLIPLFGRSDIWTRVKK